MRSAHIRIWRPGHGDARAARCGRLNTQVNRRTGLHSSLAGVGIIIEPPSDHFEVGQQVYWHQDLSDPEDDGFRAAVIQAVHRDRHGRIDSCRILPHGAGAPANAAPASLHHTPNIKADCASCTQRGWLHDAVWIGHTAQR